MSPYFHSKLSEKRFGGNWQDYQEIHEFLDSTKFHLADFRHRAILHNTFGMMLCEKLFGPIVRNSDGEVIPVREIARHHIIEDLGKCPTIEEWLRGFNPPKNLLGQVAAENQRLVNEYIYGSTKDNTDTEPKGELLRGGPDDTLGEQDNAERTDRTTGG